MQKAGSHQVRNVRDVSGANAQHQCYEVANPRILSSYWNSWTQSEKTAKYGESLRDIV